MRQWHLPLLLALVLVCTSVSSHDCGFTFEETQVIGHGDLFNYPGLWNNEVSTVMVVDRTTGNYLLYPQLGTGSSVFHDNVGGTNISLASRQEVFMFFGSDGAHKWTSVAYSRTFPVLEQDTYIFNEDEVTRLAESDGRVVWASPLCFEYRASGIKMVSDFFPVERESGAELAVGLLMTGRGECRVRVADQPQLLRSDKPADPSRSTPYILYLSRATGAVLRLRKFDVVEADLIRRAVPRGGDGYTFVGMALRGGDTTTQCVSGHGASGRRLWSTTVQTPHAHHFLWSQAYADTANPLTLFIADPSEYVELNGRRVQHGGLLFGGIDPTSGDFAWTQAVAYPGRITSTFIRYLDQDLVLLGALWDMRHDLALGSLRIPRLRRPVQGTAGLLAVYDAGARDFVAAHEVASELAYPGHNVGVAGAAGPGYRVMACPVFADDGAAQRPLDGAHSVTLPHPHADSVVLVRYAYRNCRAAAPGAGAGPGSDAAGPDAEAPSQSADNGGLRANPTPAPDSPSRGRLDPRPDPQAQGAVSSAPTGPGPDTAQAAPAASEAAWALDLRHVFSSARLVRPDVPVLCLAMALLLPLVLPPAL